MRFFLIKNVNNEDGHDFHGFRYDSTDGVQRVTVTSLKFLLKKGDLVFFDFNADTLSKLSFCSDFNRLIKELVLTLGASQVLDSVFFNRDFTDSRAEYGGLVSLRQLLQSIASKSSLPYSACPLSISSLVYLNYLSSESGDKPVLEQVDLQQDDVEVFYRQVMSKLVDEKVSRGQLKSFGLSQSLVLTKLEELLEQAYLESDLKSLELICALTDKLMLKDLYQKARTALAYSMLSHEVRSQLLFADVREEAKMNFEQYAELKSQRTVRAVAALSSFRFFNEDTALKLPGSYSAISHPLDFAFSFLEDSLLLLGYEEIFADFFYKSLRQLNSNGRLLIFQVGAFDGVHGDFLHDFIVEENCDVILIEPQSAPFEKLKINYKNARSNIIFVNKAISVGSDLVFMYRVKSNFLKYYNRDDETYLGRIASFDKNYVIDNIKQKIERWGDGRLNSNDAVDFLEEFEVEKTKFENIIDFEILKNKEVVLQVDCEGFDYKVIKSFPFDKKRPSLIHFESDKLGADKDKCFAHLRSLGYLLIEHGVKVSSDTLAIDLTSDIFIDSLSFGN